MKTYLTRGEAAGELKKRTAARHIASDLVVRRLSKKLFPRRKKRYFVGTYMDWLNI